MKKFLILLLGLSSYLIGHAQMEAEKAVILDQAEDTTQVTTINDIIVMQEMVNSRTSTDAHISNVWSRKSYFNPGYTSTKLTSKNPVPLNPDKSAALSFKSDWGALIELGHSYTLHKGAIANMLQINLDYTYIDLNVNHYKADQKIARDFNSDDKWSAGNQHEQFSYLPWGADKYDATYGMALGPSITVAPFIPLNILPLHFIKLNAYYHIGYNVGIMLMDQRDEDSNKHMSFDYLTFGHGLGTAFGLSLSWKSIGIGWETKSASLKYKPISTGEYGDRDYKFTHSSNRIYLTIRY